MEEGRGKGKEGRREGGKEGRMEGEKEERERRDSSNFGGSI